MGRTTSSRSQSGRAELEYCECHQGERDPNALRVSKEGRTGAECPLHASGRGRVLLLPANGKQWLRCNAVGSECCPFPKRMGFSRIKSEIGTYGEAVVVRRVEFRWSDDRPLLPRQFGARVRHAEAAVERFGSAAGGSALRPQHCLEARFPSHAGGRVGAGRAGVGLPHLLGVPGGLCPSERPASDVFAQRRVCAVCLFSPRFLAAIRQGDSSVYCYSTLDYALAFTLGSLSVLPTRLLFSPDSCLLAVRMKCV